MNRSVIPVALVVCLAVCNIAEAHKPSDSYLKITTGGERLAVRWDISLKDLELLVGLDADRNGEITWGELRARQQAVVEHALRHLSIDADGRTCTLRLTQLMFDEHSDGGYAVLDLSTDAPGDPETIGVRYSLLFDIDPTHRGLVLLNAGGAASAHVLSPSRPSLDLKPREHGPWRSFLVYVGEGIWHIWIGYDHVLFLVTLLLPAVLVWRDRVWQPVHGFPPMFWNVLRIVSVFTVAHTITLWLAVMDYVTLPSRLVESVIAFSIIVTAANNLRPFLPSASAGWMFALGFGLVHGFGFAGVLKDLGAESVALGVALLGFNVGVELGQICIVLAFLPVAYSLRKSVAYQWIFLWAGSALMAWLAGLWLFERAFNLQLLSF